MSQLPTPPPTPLHPANPSPRPPPILPLTLLASSAGRAWKKRVPIIDSGKHTFEPIDRGGCCCCTDDPSATPATPPVAGRAIESSVVSRVWSPWLSPGGAASRYTCRDTQRPRTRSKCPPSGWRRGRRMKHARAFSKGQRQVRCLSAGKERAWVFRRDYQYSIVNARVSLSAQPPVEETVAGRVGGSRDLLSFF